VYYNRLNEIRSTGLVLELYNNENDADLNYPLASSNIISTYSFIYRFDFPSINAYTDFADGTSITNIVNDTSALTETIFVSNTEMTGNVDITGGLSVDTITTTGNVDVSGLLLMVENVNVKDTLSSVQSQVDALINFTGGGVNFRAYSLSSALL